MSDPTVVYIVTSGEYSGYRIESVWLTLAEAEAVCPNRVKDSYGAPQVEVWPVAGAPRPLGTFWHQAWIDPTTGATTNERSGEDACIAGETPEVLVESGDRAKSWPLHIAVQAQTPERAAKVFSEVKARVINDITLGLPLEVIAQTKYVEVAE